MARIAGVDIPGTKRGEIALTYIYGIGRSSATSILGKAGINKDKKPMIGQKKRQMPFEQSLAVSSKLKEY